MDGLLLLDKPTGPTSHDVVDAVRRSLGGVKAGHTGTLDPMASGLLVIMIGRATKLAPFISGDPKEYTGTILLGLSTDSMDIQGSTVREGNYAGGEAEAGSALASLVGEQQQAPPMFSAVKYRGEPLYRYARRGEEVPRKKRAISIYRCEMTGFRPMQEKAEVDFALACSPGTYVRELATRVGDMLSCGGVLSRLRRIASGPFRVDGAITMEEMPEALHAGRLRLMPMEKAVEGMKKVVVNSECLKAAGNGAPLSGEMLEYAESGLEKGDSFRVEGGGRLIGVHRLVAEEPFASRPLRIL